MTSLFTCELDDPKDPAYQVFSKQYLVLEELGRGSWGSVFRAYNTQKKNFVAIKRVSKNNSRVNMEIETQKEASKHPAIIELFDAFSTAKHVFIVMELGTENLKHFLAKHGAYSEQEAAVTMQKILQGIAHLHECGIAHRDIKLENVLKTGKRTQDVKITDFGLSRFFSANCSMNSICGSAEYTAPEILKGVPYNEKCDMWSAGVLCFILLTGCFPFSHSVLVILYHKIQEGRFVYPADCEISNAGKDFIKRLLDIDPQQRLTAVSALTHPWIQWQGGAPASIFQDYSRPNTTKANVRIFHTL